MKHKIYSREVFYKNHKATLVGPALQCANQNSQYYLELKRTDLIAEYSVRFLLKGYQAVDDLIYLVNLRHFPVCMLGVFSIENTACKLSRKADSVSLKFKDSYAVQYGRESVSFHNNFDQDAIVYCYPQRMFKAISGLLMARNKKAMFLTERDDWLFPNEKDDTSLGNSFLTSNYISKSAFNAPVFADLVGFQKDLIQSGAHEGRHTGFYESSPLYRQTKKELSQGLAGLLAKIDYLIDFVDREDYYGYDETSELARFVCGIEYQASILEGNLFGERGARAVLDKSCRQEEEIVEQGDDALSAELECGDDRQLVPDSLFVEDGAMIDGMDDSQKLEQGVICQVELSANGLNISADIVKKLKEAGFTYVEQIKGLSQEELCEYKGIGNKTAEKILKAIG